MNKVAKERAIKFVCPLHGEQELAYIVVGLISLACGCWWSEVKDTFVYKGGRKDEVEHTSTGNAN